MDFKLQPEAKLKTAINTVLISEKSVSRSWRCGKWNEIHLGDFAASPPRKS